MTATRLCVCCSALCLVLAAQSEQSKGKETRKQDDRLRKELRSPYYKWITEDVAYILTDAERQAFNRLQTDDEREQFVEQFWLRRDPTPDTEENEFKEEHYRRIAYANEHYASGIPGWKTDRGRVYITFGPPDEIEAHPSGGSYQRPPEQGGGSGTAYPFEVWRYRYIAEIGTNVTIEFVDATMTGEYRIAMDPSEKDALAHVPRPGGTPNGLPAATANSNEFERLRQFVELHRPPPIRFGDLEALVNSTIQFNTLPMKVRADFLRVTDSTVLTPVTIQFDNSDLQFEEKDGVSRATVNLFMRVTSMTRRVVKTEEDVLNVETPATMFQQASKQSSVYQKAFYLAPGKYRLNVVAKDVNSRNANNYELALYVPSFEPGALSASSIILADMIEHVPTHQIGTGPFVFGASKVRPRVTGMFKRTEKMGVYFQVYGVGGENDRKPNGTLEYQVLGSGSIQPLIDFTEEMSAIPDASTQQVTVEKMLPLAQLEPGDYTLKIVITDRNRNQVLTPAATFSVR